jgi:hypothetical protein
LPLQKIKRFFDMADYVAWRVFLLAGAIMLLWRTLK